MKQLFKKKYGSHHLAFTLIELLIVIAVIGVLVAVILPNLMGMRGRARDTVRKNDLTQLKKALRLYFDDRGGYPNVNGTNQICCGTDPFVNPCGTPCGFGFAAGGETYMKEFPAQYTYWVSADRYSFRLTTELENAGDSDITASQQRCPGGFSTPTTYVVCED